MKHLHERDFGQSIPACLTTDAHCAIVDKWAVLSELTEAAETYGLCHRALTVLRALISFHPNRSIDPTPLGAVVFPANKTLSSRLNGMPESTLRRHLAKLVSAGIVSRHDSANRKRFARNGQGARLAFGFDLSPLARQFTNIKAEAQTARERRDALQTLRADIAQLRVQWLEIDPHSTLSETARRLLRRKPNEADLRAIKAALIKAIQSTKVSATPAQNERHIQTEITINSEETSHPNQTNADKLLKACKEYKNFFPEPICSDRKLFEVANRLAPMIEIERPVFVQSCQTMGPIMASVVVLTILERLTTIRNPGGYLRHLSNEARLGRFDAELLLREVHKPRIVS